MIKRGTEIGNDHFLLLSTVKETEITNKNKDNCRNVDFETIMAYTLKEKEVTERYAQTVAENIRIKQPKTLRESWNVFKVAINEAPKPVCGICKTTTSKKLTP